MAVGSNLGDRLGFCRRALNSLKNTPGVWLRRWSAVYLSPPEGFSSPNWFLNLVTEIITSLSPWALLFRLWQIEMACGRKRGPGLSDRTLDLDLIFYEGAWERSQVLTLPHPRFRERAFVLRPLLDILGEGSPLLREAGANQDKLRGKIYFFTFVEP